MRLLLDPQVLLPMKCTPIFMPLSITRGSYLGYCKQILWPAFHNVRSRRCAGDRLNTDLFFLQLSS